MPGIKGKGGKKGRSGRKSKAEELGLVALLDECFTVEDRKELIKALVKEAKRAPLMNMDAAKLLLSYAYGKPVDRKEVTGKDGQPIRVITAQELSDDELAAIAAGD